MVKLKMMGNVYSNSDILKAFKKVNDGDMLPEEGVFGFLYDQVDGNSVPLVIGTKKETVFFYVDHEEYIMILKENKPDWLVEVDNMIIKLIMLYNINGNQYLISFNFNMADEMYRNAISHIIKRGEFSLNYLAMLYGGLVLDSSVKYKMPDHVMKKLKSL